jgi:hypothetical protein
MKFTSEEYTKGKHWIFVNDLNRFEWYDLDHRMLCYINKSLGLLNFTMAHFDDNNQIISVDIYLPKNEFAIPHFDSDHRLISIEILRDPKLIALYKDTPDTMYVEPVVSSTEYFIIERVIGHPDLKDLPSFEWCKLHIDPTKPLF